MFSRGTAPVRQDRDWGFDGWQYFESSSTEEIEIYESEQEDPDEQEIQEGSEEDYVAEAAP